MKAAKAKNGLGTEFVRIEAGTFKMGSSDANADPNEQPVHSVQISIPFYISKCPVTQKEWKLLMQGHNPSSIKGDDYPVTDVTWNDVQKFINQLNKGGKTYRLPTEAEWEYVARCGKTTPFPFNPKCDFDQYAWHDPSTKAHPVGGKKPNAFGVCDMYGLVFEWVSDWYDSTYYHYAKADDPQGPDAGKNKVLKNTAFATDTLRPVRPSSRGFSNPKHSRFDIGFRLVMAEAADLQAGSRTNTSKQKARTNTSKQKAAGTNPQAVVNGWGKLIVAVCLILFFVIIISQVKKCATDHETPVPAQAEPAVEAAPAEVPEETEPKPDLRIEFVRIPAGSFMMGSSMDSAADDEKPRHRVTISQPFYLGKYEVTQAQWEDVMGNNTSNFTGGDRPVENVSWNDVQLFIQRLNQKEGRNKYRLPTEAEWEYAAHAGRSEGAFGAKFSETKEVENAWHVINSSGQTHPVGQRGANPWGLYDMRGNVWEWVQDWYGGDYYRCPPPVDPQGPAHGKNRVLRGGGSNSPVNKLRSSYRGALRSDLSHDDSHENVGFRLAYSDAEATIGTSVAGNCIPPGWHDLSGGTSTVGHRYMITESLAVRREDGNNYAVSLSPGDVVVLAYETTDEVALFANVFGKQQQVFTRISDWNKTQKWEENQK
ncbi:hypothetical protein FACS1894116_10500 [Betaproteobacteria bacterium]|nr:hypothetical protein FACS1894116_10500 [Betaproteobacteria bacterium]